MLLSVLREPLHYHDRWPVSFFLTLIKVWFNLIFFTFPLKDGCNYVYILWFLNLFWPSYQKIPAIGWLREWINNAGQEFHILSSCHSLRTISACIFGRNSIRKLNPLQNISWWVILLMPTGFLLISVSLVLWGRGKTLFCFTSGFRLYSG